MGNRLNAISYWVPTFTLLFEDPNDRANVINWFIRVAQSLVAKHNYSSLMGILAGLSLSCMDRMRETWALVDGCLLILFQSLVSMMSPMKSYKSYRQAIDSCE